LPRPGVDPSLLPLGNENGAFPRPRGRCAERPSPLQLAAAVGGRASCAATVLAVAMALSGCSAPVPTAAPSASASESATSTPSAAPPAEPALVPGGTAEDNRPYFEQVITALLATDPMPGGRAIIDGLTAAGFDRGAMELTPDGTTIGREADSVQFSVRIGDECLLGQAAASGHSVSAGPLADGSHCLIGKTRAIDW